MKWPAFKKLLHLMYWIIITLIFLYDRQYLLKKIGLGHFIECITVRLGLVISLAYFNLYLLIPRFFARKKYRTYFSLLILSLCAYVTLQNLYDIYLYGFVIGAEYYKRFWFGFPFNFLTTAWYLLLTTAFKLSLDWYEQRQEIKYLQLKANGHQHKTKGEEYIYIKTGTQNIKTNLSEITHIQGLKDYSIIYTAEGKIVVKGSLKLMTTRFPAPGFIRVHKSYIIAAGKIKNISKQEIILEGEIIIPIGRNFKQETEKLINCNHN
jgi:hypothetical protein